MEDTDIAMIVAMLREAMDSSHMSMQGMARNLGVSASHLSMVFSGKRRPGVRFLRAAARAYPEIARLLADRLLGTD